MCEWTCLNSITDTAKYEKKVSVSKSLQYTMCDSDPYQWDEAWVEQQLCVFHPHGHDRQPLMGSVISGELCAAHQGSTFHQAVHVDWEHLHGIRQDQLQMDTCMENVTVYFLTDT